jgi:hypothetical protein
MRARERLNFSNIGSSPAAVQKAALYEGVNLVKLGTMPLPRYVTLRSAAKVKPEELTEVEAYLAPWAPAPDGVGSASTTPANGTPARVSLGLVQPELDGFAPIMSGFWIELATRRL